MVVQVMSGGVLAGQYFTIGSDAAHQKRRVARLPFVFKLEIVVYKRGVDERVIPNAIAMNPGIYDGKREDKQK